MSYGKPMVTIGLDEYNELLKKNNPIDDAVYKQALSEVMKRVVGDRRDRFLVDRIFDAVSAIGIEMTITSSDQYATIDVNCVKKS